MKHLTFIDFRDPRIIGVFGGSQNVAFPCVLFGAMVEQWFGNSDKFFIYPLVYSLIICYMTHGLIVADKGFPSDAASGHFERNPDLHYLNPEKRNSRFIETHDLLSFSGILEGFDGVTYKKAKCIGANKWLYSFRDAASAAKEKLDWLSRAGKFYLIIFGAYGIICAAWSRLNQQKHTNENGADEGETHSSAHRKDARVTRRGMPAWGRCKRGF